MNQKFSQKAFSLIEVLITISIIAVVATVILGSLSSVQRTGRDAQRQADLNSIKSALAQYYADVNRYPNELTELGSGNALTNCSGRSLPCTVSRTYLSRVPKDPTGTAYYYRPFTDVIANACGMSGGAEVGICHKYVLCANLENPPSGSSCFSGGYNFTMTPL